ncbi:hypothetical protein D3P07_16015 [Paenibacillus sp. 1011MAR3C5]|uniref:hypothetical protein n=1 Tax=Paenibacillus sp. 1011MAR3C5 TaxID=1675787 RepID=UPI000E6C5A86|nr:hypothetical protein [Paenibacillus sp. 1011MAR3C5]RJE86695.1 hypothetical protein D3P07_16015 [Paenibacillus sp. 1011MAR3C5]
MTNPAFNWKVEFKKALIPAIIAALLSFSFWAIQNTLQTNEKERDYKIKLFEAQVSLLQDYRAAVIDRLELKILENERMGSYGQSSTDYFALQDELKSLSPALYEKAARLDDIQNRLLSNFILMENLMNAKSSEAIQNFKRDVMHLTFSDHLAIYEAYKLANNPSYIPGEQKIDYHIQEIKQAIADHYNSHLEKLLKTTSSDIF